MPASDVQGPLGLQLSLPSPHIQSTRSGPYNAQDDRLLAPGRSRSQPTGESSQGPSYGRRTQSESSLNAPAPMSVPRSPPAADNSAPEQPAPPSPVPTEIITQDLTQEEIVVEIQQSGIKVRDFAYENTVPVEQHAPELFDPVLGWHVYESMLENPNPERNPLNGRYLRRLLDLGWVSEEADGHRWLQKDREALEKFDSRPYYPWSAIKLTQPKKDDLKEVATSRFQWVNADQLVPQFAHRGMSRIAAAFRIARNAPTRYQKRPANNATETENDAETSPRLKKRRLSDAEPAASGSQTAPSAPAHFPVTLVNGKPPQQFPAGRPSNAPQPPACTQGSLSRSLQRHLSMASVSSPCTTDLTRSDSRTRLTQGADSE